MNSRVAEAVTADGVRIAYSVMGHGPPLLRIPQARWDHLEGWWAIPGYRLMMERLANEHTLVLYDPRGTGLSDRGATNYTLETQLLDARAVIDAAGIEQFAVLGWQMGSPAAIAAAWKWQDQVTALALVNPDSDGRQFLEVPEIKARQVYRTLGEPVWLEYRLVQAHSIIGDSDTQLLHQVVDLMGRACTPDVIRIHAEQHGRINVTPLLSQLPMPGFVVLSEGCPWRELSRDVARRLPRCKTVSEPGASLFWLSEQSIDALLAFLRESSRDGAAGDVTPGEPLSVRELEVLALLANGESNAEIADALSISENTVLHHVSSILRKLGAKNRTHAVSIAHRIGLLRD
jgi:DNA-binding CsgD family transcriptional regulator/pimeloyl-ACP methyl ester carboxylesterase